MKLDSLTHLQRWLVVAALCALGALFAAFVFGWTGYVQTWIGSVFRAASGAALGYLISRHVLRIDLSEIPAGVERSLAGLSVAVLIGLLAIAVANGV